MATAMKLSDELVNMAKPHAVAEHRSVPKQSNIGRALARLLRIIPNCQFSSSRIHCSLLQRPMQDNFLNTALVRDGVESSQYAFF